MTSTSRIATMTNSRMTILGEDNFSVWKWSLKYELKALRLYECVTKKDNGTQEQRDQAMLEIISSIDDRIKIKVAHCKDPFDLFQAIEAIYTNKTSFQVTALHMRLSSFKFENAANISEGISEIQSIVSKLKNLGETVSDHMVEGIVLAALPSSFRTFVTVWKGMSAEERTLSNLFNKILAEVEDNKLFNQREDNALLTRRRKNEYYRGRNCRKRHDQKNDQQDSSSDDDSSSEKSSDASNVSDDSDSSKNEEESDEDQVSDEENNERSRKTDIVCFHCGKKGHIKRFCKKWKEEKFAASKGKSDHKLHALLTVNRRVDFWVADSGASRHMTYNLDWIDDYASFSKPKEIFFADKGHCLAYGSGKIPTKAGVMHNVYYVPGLANNLFSVSSACSKGIKAIYDHKTVVFRRRSEVILRGVKMHGIYILDVGVELPKEATTTHQDLNEDIISSMDNDHQEGTTEDIDQDITHEAIDDEPIRIEEAVADHQVEVSTNMGVEGARNVCDFAMTRVAVGLALMIVGFLLAGEMAQRL